MKAKIKAISIYILVYLLGYVVGLMSFYLLPISVPLILRILIADVISTIFVWGQSILFGTTSIYDPYWSIAPFLIYLSLMVFYKVYTINAFLMLGFLGFWSIRLTLNFFIGLKDISYCDYRYTKYRSITGRLYDLFSLGAFCLFPTLLVYLGSIPMFLLIEEGAQFSYFFFIFYFIMFLGTILEIISDIELANFIKVRKSHDEVLNKGLFKYSRHPNYLGEIMIWFGIYFAYLPTNLNNFYYIIGAVLILFLFVFISIPLCEKHYVTYKPTYKDYQKVTSMLLILPNRRK